MMTLLRGALLHYRAGIWSRHPETFFAEFLLACFT